MQRIPRQFLTALFGLLFVLNITVAAVGLVRFQAFVPTKDNTIPFFLLAGGVALTVFVLRQIRRLQQRTISTREELWIAGPGILLGIFLVLPGRNLLALLLFVLLFALVYAPERLSKRRPAENEKDDFQENELENGEAEYDEETVDENVVMQLSRSQSPEGVDRLECSLRVRFLPGERIVNAHVPFCPLFERLPEVEAHQLEGEEVDLAVAQRSPLGVRIDLKRPSGRNGEETVRILLFAECS